MSNVHDLQRYVKRHPDDRAQRWRLAKKLYMAGDFEEALSHLRVLRKHWPTKLNIARYLAATHYRMGNNSEAIRELEISLKAWPDEVPIRQQLARALEAAGHHAAAVRAWQEILSRQPNHPFAADALRILSGKKSAPKKPGPPVESVSIPETGRRCPSCGAENGDEFERCWQCHAALANDDHAYNAEPPASTPFRPAPSLIDLQDHIPVMITAMFVALIATGISAFGFFEAWTVQHTPPAELDGNASVHTILATELFALRLSIGIVLAVFCPIALWAASFAIRIPMPTIGTIIAVGLANASVATALTWLPMSLLRFAPFICVAAVFALIVWLFSPRYFRGAAIAAAQCVAIFGLAAGAAYQLEGPEFLGELPAIVEYGAEHDAQPHRGRHELLSVPTPAEYTFQFATTGSQWLNENGAPIRIEIASDQPDGQMDVELFEYERSLDYYWADPVIIPFDAKLGRPYRLTLDGKKMPANVHGTIVGILPLQIHTGDEPGN